MTRPSWDEYFIDIANTIARRSTCLRAPDGVGSIIVRDKQILATGYAGSLKGQPHCTEVGCLIDEKTGGCRRTVHAEINSILQAAVHGVSIKGATIYTTLSPCWDCFKAIVNGGIERIVYDQEYRIIDLQRQFSDSCQIKFERYVR
jgi:dCMP deaminase